MTGLHLDVDRRGRGLARRIAEQLREAVRGGRLAAGERLPASRELARDLGVSRGVVVEAYEQLVAEGFLVSRQGAGTRVARVPSAPSRPEPPPVDGRVPAAPRYEVRVGRPDLAAFPRRLWLAATREVLNGLPHSSFDYPDPAGAPELREVLAGYLTRVRAADVDPARIMIVGGVAHGLSLLVRALGARLLAVEDPASPRQLPLLRSAGAELVGVPVDGEGMDVEALRATSATAVLLTPAHQYPTGVVLSPRRRAGLREWLAERAAVAIEDDYDAEFRYDRDPVGCLQGLDPHRTVLLGSVSKSLAPALRLGWIVAPAGLMDRLRELRTTSDLGSPVLEQHVLARLIAAGAYERHVRAMRLRYRERRDALVAALAHRLPEARVEGVSAGQHLYVEVPGADEEAVVARAAALGVAVQGAGEFRLEKDGPAALVLGFAGLPPRRIEEAVALLAEAVRGPAGR